MIRNPIIVALDVPEPAQALSLATDLASVVGAVKIGSELFTSGGPDIVRQVRATGASVFLDLKFHDIPNTVAKSVSAAVKLDVQMLTIHTCGGVEMMRAAEESAQKTAAALGRPVPLVLGVTVLTSMDSSDLQEIGLTSEVGCQVERLARLAVQAGLRGLVCSPHEVVMLRKIVPIDFALITPGIRPAGPAGDDQKRTMTPRQAMAAGSTWLVIGRPIYAAPVPRTAAASIFQSLA
jgi:orotidine-5'-phosphate decarboxylase